MTNSPSNSKISRLRQDAKRLTRTTGVPLHQAHAAIALEQGFANWSLMVRQAAGARTALDTLASTLRLTDFHLQLTRVLLSHLGAALDRHAVPVTVTLNAVLNAMGLDAAKVAADGAGDRLGHAAAPDRVVDALFDLFLDEHASDGSGRAVGRFSVLHYFELPDDERIRFLIGAEFLRHLQVLAHHRGVPVF